MRKFGTLLLLAIVLLATLTTCAAEPASPSRTLRIVCIGDSITQGGVRDRAEYTYRWLLFQMLVDAGVAFDFVGSLQSGLHPDAEWPAAYDGVPFDRDHEGIYGIETAAARARLPAAIAQWPAAPDIALIHLGTNDRDARDYARAVKAPLREIIALLREENPAITILLGHLMFNDSPAAFRIMAEVAELRQEIDIEESPVRVVPHYHGWNDRPGRADSDTFDWVHPNPNGQRKMARNWLSAMQPWLREFRDSERVQPETP